MANSEDLNRLTACSLVLLGSTFLSQGITQVVHCLFVCLFFYFVLFLFYYYMYDDHHLHHYVYIYLFIHLFIFDIFIHLIFIY